MNPTHSRRISVVGLGYVGLPVVVAFGRTARVVGFDVNPGNGGLMLCSVEENKSVPISKGAGVQ